jgi:hypothetical protein
MRDTREIFIHVGDLFDGRGLIQGYTYISNSPPSIFFILLSSSGTSFDPSNQPCGSRTNVPRLLILNKHEEQ